MESTCEPRTQEEREKAHADNFNSGTGSLNLNDDYNCDICKNKGLIMKAIEIHPGMWTTTTKECKCMDVRRSIVNMRKSGLENVIKKCTFKNFEAEEEWQIKLKHAAMEYANNPEGWFFIGGQTGAGKSHLCTAICRELLLNGLSVKYMLWRDEVVRLKKFPDDYDRIISDFKNVEVLYIDDLFKTGRSDEGSVQKPTAADVNIAFEILNFRYCNPKLLTIISSECTIDNILDIDEALGGRIFERAKAFSLKPDRNKNFRLKGVTEL